jgi:hypothetical protein
MFPDNSYPKICAHLSVTLSIFYSVAGIGGEIYPSQDFHYTGKYTLAYCDVRNGNRTPDSTVYVLQSRAQSILNYHRVLSTYVNYEMWMENSSYILR